MHGYGHKTPRLCVALGFTMFFLLRERLSHSVSPLLEKVSVAIAFAADKKAPLPGKLCPSLCLGALSSSCPLQRLPHNQTASYYLFSWSREVKSSRIASHESLGYFWLLFMNEVASLSTMSVASVRKFEGRRPSSLKPLRIHHSPQALNRHSPIPPLAAPSPPSCPDPLFLAYRLWDSDKSTFWGGWRMEKSESVSWDSKRDWTHSFILYASQENRSLQGTHLFSLSSPSITISQHAW